MHVQWDYTLLAKAYLKRPDYSQAALDRLYKTAALKAGALICDIGAGAGHLTLPMLRSGFVVTSVEPNDEMRKFGQERTSDFKKCRWVVGTGERSNQPARTYDLVTFGSSFNVTSRPDALKETARILKPGGWFACMWNHRNLDDPIQSKIECSIKAVLPDYAYGTRREDQTAVIKRSGLFEDVCQFRKNVRHTIDKEDFIEGWRSHGTLQRQAGWQFEEIIDRIGEIVSRVASDSVVVPYTTAVWMARLRA